MKVRAASVCIQEKSPGEANPVLGKVETRLPKKGEWEDDVNGTRTFIPVLGKALMCDFSFF